MMYVVVVSLGMWRESLLYIDVVRGRKVIDFVASAAMYQLGNKGDPRVNIHNHGEILNY
jgi:hypothetical protein